MEKSIHGLFVFPQKKILTWRRHCSISQSCSSMTSKRSIGWFLESSRAWTFFSPERSINQPKATRVCIRSINQSNRSISVRLLFLFCSRGFIPRSYENGSNIIIYMMLTPNARTKFNPLFPCEVQIRDLRITTQMRIRVWHWCTRSPVPDPDLEKREGGGGGAVKKKIFSGPLSLNLVYR